jgi:hypothetical protein
MKYLVLIIIFASGMAACQQPVKGRNGEVYKSAVQYNNYIVNRQSTIMGDIMEFARVSQTSLDSAGTMLDKYIPDIDVMINDIKGMPPYQGDSSLRDAAVNSFSFYKRIFGNEYKRLIAIRLTAANFADRGVAEMNGIVSQISKEEESYDKVFHNAQRDFAQKNNMSLEENEMQKKMEKMKK